MNKQILFDFIRKFNALESISDEVLMEGFKALSKEEQKLLILLVNYKNGATFKDMFVNGEI